MNGTAQSLKGKLPPERYYTARLNGSFGKPTDQGWHRWNGLCPFHDDKRAGSFVINIRTGAFRCFSCGARGGDIIDFHMQRHRLCFTDAFNELTETAKCARS